MIKYLFFLFLLACQLSYSQQLFFEHFSPKQKLPSSETYNIFQDSNGYLWFTTDAGLCKYNGKELKVFTTNDGIPENVIFGIYEDKYKRVWFSTLSGYLFYYYNEKFHSIAANPQLKKMCNSYPGNSFFVGQKDTIYYATPGTPGIVKIAPENNYEKIILKTEPYTISNRFIYSNILNKEELIVGSGKFKINAIDSVFYLWLNNKNYAISYKGVSQSTGNSWRGKIDKSGNTFILTSNTIAKIDKQGNIGYKRFLQSILSIYIDNAGNLWLGLAKGGLYFIKDADFNNTPEQLFNSLSVAKIIEDREGTIWLSTLEDGIYKTLNKNVYNYNFNNTLADFHATNDNLYAIFNKKNIWKFEKNKKTYIELDNKLENEPKIFNFYDFKSNYYFTNQCLF